MDDTEAWTYDESHRHTEGARPDRAPVLYVTCGRAAGSSVYLRGEEVTIGRDSGATLTLDDPTVSRRHVTIRPAEGGYEIEDARSVNGTYVNGRRVDRAALQDGDELRIGRFCLVYLERIAA